MSPEVLVLAPMRMGDLRAVLRIEEECFPDPWSKRLFEEELKQRTSRSYRAAWVGHDLVGFAGQMFIDDESHVNNVAVDPARQGERIGGALLVDLVRNALDRGQRHLTLEVRVGNEPAIALYRRLGLAPVGVRPNYYPNGGDALIMWAHDLDDPAYEERLAGLEAELAAHWTIDRRF